MPPRLNGPVPKLVCDLSGSDLLFTRFDRNDTGALADRFGGVEGQIHKHLLHLAGVRLDRRNAGGEIEVESDSLRDRTLNQAAGLADQRR